MPDATKPFTRGTKITTTVGVILLGVATVAAASGWATSLDSRVESIAQSVWRIEQNVDKMADFNARLAVLEAFAAQNLRGTP